MRTDRSIWSWWHPRAIRPLAALAALALAAACAGPTPPSSESPRRLTDHPAEDRAPSWSPDGETLLFASDRDGDYEIYSIRTDGEALERLTHDQAKDMSPAWSPDGTRFVFESDREGGNGLWIFDLSTRTTRRLVSDPSPELLPDWSPDGEWIAFTSERAGNPDLYRIRIEDGTIERLTDSEYRDLWPRYSTDGAQLVFFSRRATEGRFDDLFMLDLESRAIVQVTDHPTHHDFVPDFAPGGRRIVAGMSDRDAGRRELRIHDVAGAPDRLLVDGCHRVFHPAWSPDGRSIAYAARAAEGERADVYVIAVRD